MKKVNEFTYLIFGLAAVLCIIPVHTFGMPDIVLHLSVFLVIGALSPSMMFGILFGAACELIQIYIPSRSFDIHDLAANIGGVIIGYVLLRAILIDSVR